MRKLAVLACVLLSGCASAPEWRHSELSGLEADRAFLIADGRCTKEASAITMPAAPTPQTGYRVSGTSQTTYGSSNSNTRFNAEAQPDHGPLAIYERSQAAAERGAAEGARRRVYAGCMAESGWMRTQ